MKLSKQAIAALLFTALSYYAAGDDGEYGVDVSWPMHHQEWTPLNQERKEAYDEFMEGCREAYGAKGHLCDVNEEDRIEMTLRQPQSMVNYTDTGFMKIKAPKELKELLTKHWEINKDARAKENWPKVSYCTTQEH